MDRRLEAALAAALGGGVGSSRLLSGGDINQAYEVALADGRRVFVKTNPRSPRGMFAAEARGLAWLAEAGALRIPRVLAVSSPDDEPAFLALELVQTGPRRDDSRRGSLSFAQASPSREVRNPSEGSDFDERLGQGLAALHRHGAPAFGLDHDNFIGRLPQKNNQMGTLRGFPNPPATTSPGKAQLRPRDTPATATWAEFYRARRLEPQLRRAVDAGLASPQMRRGFDRLFAALADLVGPDEAPARLHGNLWGGNLLCDDAGAPCLIDPAVYGGHREVNLAMMRLFGGFGARVFAAYREAWPLAEGHEDRVPLYQLYPLLVHVNLFGGGYVGSVESALARLC